MDSIHSIVIAGATHGNERTGVELVQKWGNCPEKIQKFCPSAKIDFVLSNPVAMRENRP